MAGRENDKLTNPERTADPGNVTVRCGPCVHRLGRSAPALMVVEVDNPMVGNKLWRIVRISARQRDKTRAASAAYSQRLEGSAAREGLDLSRTEDLLQFVAAELDERAVPELGPDEDVDRAPWISVGWTDRATGRIHYPKSVELA